MSLINFIMENPVFYRFLSSRVDRVKLEAIKRIRESFSGLRVLDLGCGPGNSVKIFLDSDYTGIDINPQYIRRARRSYPGLKFITADLTEFELDDEFDVILINSFLHHLNIPPAEKILRRSATSLSAEGKIILQEPIRPWPDQLWQRMIMRLDRGDYFRSLTDWRRLTDKSGLYPVDYFFYSLRIIGIKSYQMVGMTLERKHP